MRVLVTLLIPQRAGKTLGLPGAGGIGCGGRTGGTGGTGGGGLTGGNGGGLGAGGPKMKGASASDAQHTCFLFF